MSVSELTEGVIFYNTTVLPCCHCQAALSLAAYACYNAIRDDNLTAGAAAHPAERGGETMKRWRNLLCMAMAAALCISLAACGGTNDAMGDDWRASGDVAASGTITHDGESVDVLVTISPSSAAFYRDIAEQVLFDSVSFPMNIADAEQAFNAISFDDMDGDGESDVLVSFIHENGDETELIWIWDPVERYVYREDLSTVPGEEETFFPNYDEQTEEP